MAFFHYKNKKRDSCCSCMWCGFVTVLTTFGGIYFLLLFAMLFFTFYTSFVIYGSYESFTNPVNQTNQTISCSPAIYYSSFVSVTCLYALLFVVVIISSGVWFYEKVLQQKLQWLYLYISCCLFERQCLVCSSSRQCLVSFVSHLSQCTLLYCSITEFQSSLDSGLVKIWSCEKVVRSHTGQSKCCFNYVKNIVMDSPNFEVYTVWRKKNKKINFGHLGTWSVLS